MAQFLVKLFLIQAAYGESTIPTASIPLSSALCQILPLSYCSRDTPLTRPRSMSADRTRHKQAAGHRGPSISQVLTAAGFFAAGATRPVDPSFTPGNPQVPGAPAGQYPPVSGPPPVQPTPGEQHGT